jgi:hypothetical protein
MANTAGRIILTAPSLPDPERANLGAGVSRFRCLPADQEEREPDEEWMDEDDGFQCPCCLNR